jgi:hypothetical protein
VNSSCASSVASDFSLAATEHPSLSLNIEKIEVYLFSMQGVNQIIHHFSLFICSKSNDQCSMPNVQ